MEEFQRLNVMFVHKLIVMLWFSKFNKSYALQNLTKIRESTPKIAYKFP